MGGSSGGEAVSNPLAGVFRRSRGGADVVRGGGIADP